MKLFTMVTYCKCNIYWFIWTPMFVAYSVIIKGTVVICLKYRVSEQWSLSNIGLATHSNINKHFSPDKSVSFASAIARHGEKLHIYFNMHFRN